MSLLNKAREVSGELAAASKRQAQRGKLELTVRRLKSKVSSEKDAIGQALFPLLEAGTLTIDLPEVRDHMQAIADLQAEIARKRADIEALREADDLPGAEPGDQATGEPRDSAEQHGEV